VAESLAKTSQILIWVVITEVRGALVEIEIAVAIEVEVERGFQ
jgi:hypothetical protein